MAYYNKYRPQKISDLDSKEIREKLEKIFQPIHEEYEMIIERNGKEVFIKDLSYAELLEEKENAKVALEKFIKEEGVLNEDDMRQQQEKIFEKYLLIRKESNDVKGKS